MNLSKVELEYNYSYFCLLGIYAFYNNNSTENFLLQENLVDSCKQILSAENVKNKNILLIGDFNSDPFRKNKFDML
jgi:hypothetical protein